MNLIFVDSPVETGYSYTNDTDYKFNDYNTGKSAAAAAPPDARLLYF